MSIQVDDGEFTRLHNTILNKLALARLTASEFRCLMFLFRMTYGWQKKEDVISLSQWAAGVGIDPDKKRHNVLRTLQGLVAKRVIYTKTHGNNHAATWGFNKHFDDWDTSLFIDTVISPDNTSVISEDNTDAQTVITQDNTTVISPDNKTVISRDNHKRKKEILKKKGESAPARIASPSETPSKAIHYKSRHLDIRHFVDGYIPTGKAVNAVEVYYERFSINQDNARLNAIKEDDLARICTDLDKLREVVTAYSRTSFLPGNVQLILDWYKDGVPDKSKAQGKGNLSDVQKSAIQTRARNARTALDTAKKFGGNIDPKWQEAIETAKGHGLA